MLEILVKLIGVNKGRRVTFEILLPFSFYLFTLRLLRYKFQIEVNEPYPELNGGQNIRRAKGPVHSIRYIYYDPPQKNIGILASLKYEM